jgi:TPP-dependent pyruvate/acetoin dehydrogenase alpha subunit
MQAAGPIGIDELDAIDARNKALMDDAESFARNSPLPEPHELYTDVYVS